MQCQTTLCLFMEIDCYKYFIDISKKRYLTWDICLCDLIGFIHSFVPFPGSQGCVCVFVCVFTFTINFHKNCRVVKYVIIKKMKQKGQCQVLYPSRSVSPYCFYWSNYLVLLELFILFSFLPVHIGLFRGQQQNIYLI